MNGPTATHGPPEALSDIDARGEPAYLRATRLTYDTIADDYSSQLSSALAASPFDRAVLGVFAELVRTSDGGPVADVGCGPGRIAAHLSTLGARVFGIDLSPGMVEVAQRSYPALNFTTGSMNSLDIPAGHLAGLVAWYSIIHTPPEQLPIVVAEFARVLRVGGHVALAFQVGDERRHIEHGYGHAVSVDAYRLVPDRIAALLGQFGLFVHARLIREPTPPESTPQAYLLATKVVGAG